MVTLAAIQTKVCILSSLIDHLVAYIVLATSSSTNVSYPIGHKHANFRLL